MAFIFQIRHNYVQQSRQRQELEEINYSSAASVEDDVVDVDSPRQYPQPSAQLNIDVIIESPEKRRTVAPNGEPVNSSYESLQDQMEIDVDLVIPESPIKLRIRSPLKVPVMVKVGYEPSLSPRKILAEKKMIQEKWELEEKKRKAAKKYAKKMKVYPLGKGKQENISRFLSNEATNPFEKLSQATQSQQTYSSQRKSKPKSVGGRGKISEKFLNQVKSDSSQGRLNGFLGISSDVSSQALKRKASTQAESSAKRQQLGD